MMASMADTHHDSEDHHEFRSLSMLLTLVTAINNAGCPTFKLDAPIYRGLETYQPPKYLVLNAVAAILVRNREIVAAVGHANNSVVAVHDEHEPPEDQVDPDVAMNDGIDHKETLFRPFSSFTAIPNPRDQDVGLSANHDSPVYKSTTANLIGPNATEGRKVST
jgi:hypothetical protein